MKSFLPFSFAITKICVAIRLAEDGTKMGGIWFRLSPSNIKKSLGFSQLNTFFATSWKCLCTHFGHMCKTKTSLNILLRIIEHENRLPDMTIDFMTIDFRTICFSIDYVSCEYCEILRTAFFMEHLRWLLMKNS